MLLEDLVVHTQYQGHATATSFSNTRSISRRRKTFSNHVVDRSPENVAQGFPEHGFVDSSMIPIALVGQHPERGTESKE